MRLLSHVVLREERWLRTPETVAARVHVVKHCAAGASSKGLIILGDYERAPITGVIPHCTQDPADFSQQVSQAHACVQSITRPGFLVL